MKKMMPLVLLGAALSISAPATGAGVGIAAEAGTTGAGLRLTVPLSERLHTRIGFGALGISKSRNVDDVEYDAKLKLKTADLLFDFYPMAQGSFRLTAGLAYNGNEVDVRAEPDSNAQYTFGNNTYAAALAGTVDGNVRWKRSAPYVGLGWGNAADHRKGWGFTSDFGVLFQGSARTSLTNRDCQLGPALCAQLAGDLAEENAELRDKADDFKFFPVLRVGITYRF